MGPGSPRRVALVLAGGAARSAYEVGVLSHLVDGVARDVGGPPALDIISGTSAGAIHACALAAMADDPRAAVSRLARTWAGLELPDVLRPAGREVLGMLCTLLGPAAARAATRRRRGGIIDPRPLERLMVSAIPFPRIREHLRAGRLAAVTVSATHVASGRTTVFVQQAAARLPSWSRDPTVVLRRAELTPAHALASAAVPLLFPAVRVGGELYCDGGLRQLVPLAPACRLGADALIVVSPSQAPGPPTPEEQREREQAFASPVYLIGKALDALLLGSIDEDLARLEHVNAILAAGTRRWGGGFVPALNHELGAPAHEALRPIHATVIRASQDLGLLSAEYVRSRAFARRAGGAVGRILRRLADADGSRETDLLSYLLLDGAFAVQLMALGRADARARHDELCAVLAPRRKAA